MSVIAASQVISNDIAKVPVCARVVDLDILVRDVLGVLGDCRWHVGSPSKRGGQVPTRASTGNPAMRRPSVTSPRASRTRTA
jgi:hypothetical protein